MADILLRNPLKYQKINMINISIGVVDTILVYDPFKCFISPLYFIDYKIDT